MAEEADSTAPVNDPAPSEGSDPAPEDTEAPAEAPPEQSSEAAEPEVSMADAFAEAQRELSGDEDASTTEGGEDESAAEALDAELGEADAESGESSEEQTGEGQAEETPEETATSDQIAAMREKVANGRFNELTYEERQLWDATKTQVTEEQQLWNTLRDQYLRLKSLRSDDPDAFLQEMEQNPRRWAAFRKFEEQYPNVSEENPTPQKGEKEIRQEIDNKYASTINETVKQAANEAGLGEDKFNELVQKHGNRLGSLMVETVKQAAEQSANARLEKQLEQRLAEEREAIRKELEVQYAGQNKVRFPSGGTSKDPNTREPSNAPMTIQQAHAEAKAELEQRAS